jgi:glycosyltransferase involved in cell wall biosynthesis/SAM-dependent methyltransferase
VPTREAGETTPERVRAGIYLCTIVARNYLAQARVLADSVAAHHPENRLHVLVVDGESGGYDRAQEPFVAHLPSELCLDADEFRRMAAIYDVTELCTAVKPLFLRLLLEQGAESVLYLDPDIEVFAPLDDIGALARGHGIVLTPHSLTPIPPDGKRPTPDDIANAGIFNLGFIAIGRQARPFLDWWDARLRRDCLMAVEEGMHVDQRVIDFAPAYFEPYVMRDPAVNVAYWNLHERKTRWSGERFEVDGAPLRFFHFSGFDPGQPRVLSKHMGDRPRIRLDDEPGVDRLCRAYSEKLMSAGFGNATTLSYGFAVTPTGLPLDRRARRLYRRALIAAESDGAPLPPDPLDPAEAEAFVTWLRSPDPSTPKVGRYFLAVYNERRDLRDAFPDLRGEGAAGFLEWIRNDGRADPPIPVALRNGDRGTPKGSVSTPAERGEGVNVIGYVRAELGVGEAARLYIASLKAGGIPYAVVPYRTPWSRESYPFNDSRLGAPQYDVSLVCVNADQFPRFIEDGGATLIQGSYAIAMWWWEVEVFPPSMAASSRFVEEIWVGSRHAARAIAASVDRPVVVMPPPIVAPRPAVLGRADLGLPEGFLFLFSFDFYSVMQRKNPLGLIDAYQRAFGEADGAHLIIKTINGDKRADEMARLREAVGERQDIQINDGYLPIDVLHAWINECDAYVSLHRSEGFGFGMAEAMALGKPVIATAYSGNLEFMTDANSYLVPYQLVPVPTGCEPYPSGARWADPDLDKAARLMRGVFEDKDEARRRGELARADVLDRYGMEARAGAINKQLAVIRGRRGEAAHATAVPAVSAVLRGEPSVELPARSNALRLAAAPVPLGSRVRPLRFVQRVLLRLLRPLTVYVRQLGSANVEALVETEGRLTAALNSLAADQQALVRRLRLAEGDIRNAGREFASVRDSLQAVPYMAHPALLQTKDAHGRRVLGYSRQDAISSRKTYFEFEEMFRGTEDFIRERQRVYVPMLTGHEPVVDIGCGRGELLDLLAKEGVKAVGVDLDADMVERCRSKGHDVVRADALSYLRDHADASFGAIFSAQFVEHISYEDLLAFLDLAERKLKPGGVFVAETVNPHSVSAFKTFWVDLTHEKPIFPETLLALCRTTGFAEARVLYPNGEGSQERDRTREGEYAVVARKS